MPLNPLVSSLISSIITAILEAPEVPPQAPTVAYSAIMRTFPAHAVPGVMTQAPYMGRMVIDGTTYNVAPGLQIRNEFNRIVFASRLAGGNYPVLYQMDATGSNVWRIWILTPPEIAALANAGRPVVKPVTLPAALPAEIDPTQLY
jgi:hypothetical protein